MPEIFGWQHIVYLVIFVVLSAVSIILIKKYCKTERALIISIKSTAALLLAFIIWNRICIVISNEDWFMLLPNTFCGITSFAFAVCALAFVRDNPTLHCLIYCGFVGGLITMIYPDFISQNQSFFYPNTISGLLHHSVSLYLSVLMLITGWVKPALNKWKYFPIGMAFMMVYGVLLLSISGRMTDDGYDAMYIKHPLLEGTPLTWYVVGALMLILHIAFLLCWTYIPKFIEKRRITKAADNYTDTAD